MFENAFEAMGKVLRHFSKTSDNTQVVFSHIAGELEQPIAPEQPTDVQEKEEGVSCMHASLQIELEKIQNLLKQPHKNSDFHATSMKWILQIQQSMCNQEQVGDSASLRPLVYSLSPMSPMRVSFSIAKALCHYLQYFQIHSDTIQGHLENILLLLMNKFQNPQHGYLQCTVGDCLLINLLDLFIIHGHSSDWITLFDCCVQTKHPELSIVALHDVQDIIVQHQEDFKSFSLPTEDTHSKLNDQPVLSSVTEDFKDSGLKKFVRMATMATDATQKKLSKIKEDGTEQVNAFTAKMKGKLKFSTKNSSPTLQGENCSTDTVAKPCNSTEITRKPKKAPARIVHFPSDDSVTILSTDCPISADTPPIEEDVTSNFNTVHAVATNSMPVRLDSMEEHRDAINDRDLVLSSVAEIHQNVEEHCISPDVVDAVQNFNPVKVVENTSTLINDSATVYPGCSGAVEEEHQEEDIGLVALSTENPRNSGASAALLINEAKVNLRANLRAKLELYLSQSSKDFCSPETRLNNFVTELPEKEKEILNSFFSFNQDFIKSLMVQCTNPYASKICKSQCTAYIFQQFDTFPRSPYNLNFLKFSDRLGAINKYTLTKDDQDFLNQYFKYTDHDLCRNFKTFLHNMLSICTTLQTQIIPSDMDKISFWKQLKSGCLFFRQNTTFHVLETYTKLCGIPLTRSSLQKHVMNASRRQLLRHHRILIMPWASKPEIADAFSEAIMSKYCLSEIQCYARILQERNAQLAAAAADNYNVKDIVSAEYHVATTWYHNFSQSSTTMLWDPRCLHPMHEELQKFKNFFDEYQAFTTLGKQKNQDRYNELIQKQKNNELLLTNLLMDLKEEKREPCHSFAVSPRFEQQSTTSSSHSRWISSNGSWLRCDAYNAHHSIFSSKINHRACDDSEHEPLNYSI